MPKDVIHTSQFEDEKVIRRSVFTHLFQDDSSGLIGGLDGRLPAFIDAATGTTLSRAQLRSLALRVGYGLTSVDSPINIPAYHSKEQFRKLQKGDTVLIFSPNSITWPPLLFGAVAAGLRITLANSSYTATELQHQYEDSRALAVFAHPSLLKIVADMFKAQGIPAAHARARTIVMGTEWLTQVPGEGETDIPAEWTNGLVSVGQLIEGPVNGISNKKLAAPVRFDGGAADETVYLCYSSGTTGKPKGVETTHTNVNAVVRIVTPALDITTKDVGLGVLPIFHIYGIIKILHYPLFAGAPIAIMPRFDPDKFCANIARYKVTFSMIVPPILIALLRHPATTKNDLTSLRLLFSGAAPLGAPLASAVQEKLGSVGAKVLITQGYGLTETSPVTHILPAEHSNRKVGTIGLLLPNLEARLVEGDSDEDAVDVPLGEPGELWIRGPTVMKGYLNNPSATASSITPKKWFRTGDIAIVDEEGFYKIVDRRKELIKYKGFQVPPAELESVLLTNPDVADAAVIGVYDEKEATELPRAYIVAANKDKASSLPDEMQAWIKTKVAKHKFLRGGVVVIDVVPKSAAGKILRRELRIRAAEEIAKETKSKL